MASVCVSFTLPLFSWERQNNHISYALYMCDHEKDVKTTIATTVWNLKSWNIVQYYSWDSGMIHEDV